MIKNDDSEKKLLWWSNKDRNTGEVQSTMSKYRKRESYIVDSGQVSQMHLMKCEVNYRAQESGYNVHLFIIIQHKAVQQSASCRPFVLPGWSVEHELWSLSQRKAAG